MSGGVCLGVCVCVQGYMPRGMYTPWDPQADTQRPRGRHPLPITYWDTNTLSITYWDTPPREQNDCQTGVRTLPCPKLRLRVVMIIFLIDSDGNVNGENISEEGMNNRSYEVDKREIKDNQADGNTTVLNGNEGRSVSRGGKGGHTHN